MITAFQKLFTIKKEILKLMGTAIVLFFVTLFMFFQFLKHQEFVKASPYDVVVSDIQANSVTISWKTKVKTPTYLRIMSSEKLLGQGEESTFHRIKILNLKELSPYEFVITDGKREWNRPHQSSSKGLSTFTKKEYSFITNQTPDKVFLPQVEELSMLPDELVYLMVYDKENSQYLGPKSYIANQFGGIVVDIAAFNPNLKEGEYELKILEYFSTSNLKSSDNRVYAYEINCDQSIPEQKIDGVSKEEFVDFASRWVNGRGKNYASECFNDVVYSSKMAGIDPAFTLAVWLNESAASNYTQNMTQFGHIEDFGIHGLSSVPPHNFKKQLNHFLSRNHVNKCPGLNQWESWGNIYRYGTCNELNSVTRQKGIDYYKRIESLYSWITKGQRLPNNISNLPIPVDVGIDGGNWSGIANSACCAQRYGKNEHFIGEYFEDIGSQSCMDIFKSDKFFRERGVSYSVEIADTKGAECIKNYEGVCCKLPNDILWYPKDSCPYVVTNISSSKQCQEYAEERACFYREFFFQWLPKNIGEDSLKDVLTKEECLERNNTFEYSLKLKKGINFIAFNFTPSYRNDVLYASRLMSMYPEISLIGNFNNSEWKDLIKKSNKTPFVGRDFFFEQEKGYLIITEDNISLNLDGWIKDSKNFNNLSSGWNLVSADVNMKSKKASTLLSEIRKALIDVDAIGVWSYELGNLVYRVEQNNGEVFGEDVEIEKNQAVFLRK